MRLEAGGCLGADDARLLHTMLHKDTCGHVHEPTRRTTRLCRMAGAVELHAGAPASPAAAKRAAIIERYSLGRIPPIPIPSLEQMKEDAGSKVPATASCRATARLHIIAEA